MAQVELGAFNKRRGFLRVLWKLCEGWLTALLSIVGGCRGVTAGDNWPMATRCTALGGAAARWPPDDTIIVQIHNSKYFEH